MNSVVLVGLGNVGIGYDIRGESFINGQTMTHAKAVLDSSEFELIGLADISIEKLTSAQRIIQVPSINPAAVTNDNFTPDIVVIAVSTTQHASVIESLVYPPKVLVLEKPAGLNSVECSRIHSWGVKNKVQIFVNYFRRYLSSSVNSRDYFGKLNAGRFLSAEINAYGTLLNIHSHFIDLAFFLTNRRVFCHCTKKLIGQMGENLEAFCESCGVSFRLNGIGTPKQDISMKLRFENIEMMIGEDGRRIEVIDLINRLTTVFECRFAEYENYQKIFYQKLGEMLGSGKYEESYIGLTEANMVHLFLESVESKDEA